MSKICGYSCEHNKSGICQISVCDKKSNMQASCEASITNPKKQLEFYKQLSEQLQQENKKQKEVFDKLKEFINKYAYRPDILHGQLNLNYEEFNELLDILKEVSE